MPTIFVYTQVEENKSAQKVKRFERFHQRRSNLARSLTATTDDLIEGTEAEESEENGEPEIDGAEGAKCVEDFYEAEIFQAEL